MMKKSLSLFLALLMALVLVGCGSGEVTPPEPTQAPEPAEDFAEPARPVGDSRPLRLFWFARDGYNPLTTYDFSGKAVNSLIYQGLFTQDRHGFVSADLADSFAWSEPYYRLAVLFDEVRYFADGSQVSADDILYSLNVYAAGLAAKFGESWENLAFYAEGGNTEPEDIMTTDPETGMTVPPENVEPEPEETDPESDPAALTTLDKPDYAAYLANPKDGTPADDIDEDRTDESDRDNDGKPDSVRGPLPQTDIPDYQAWQAFHSLRNIRRVTRGERGTVTFDLKQNDPSLPYALTFPIVASTSSASGIPYGTGAYTVTHFDQGTMTLAARDERDSLQTIEVKPYRRISEAMRALSAYELDLIVLDSYYDSIYRQRRDLTRHPFVSSDFLMILPCGNLAGNRAKFDDIGNLLQSDDALIDNIVGIGATGNLPLVDDNLTIAERHQLSLEKTEDPETLLFNYSDNLDEFVPHRVADDVRRYFKVEVTAFPAAEMYQVTAEGDADLTLVRMDLGAPADPAGALADIAALTGTELPDLPDISANRYAPPAAREPIASDDLAVYRETAEAMNFIGLGFMEGSVLMNQSVYGTLLPSQAQPYRGIEDLWVGQDGSYLSP